MSDSIESAIEFPAYSVLLVNDNYIATWLPGEKGHYFGADDFLTGALYTAVYLKKWQYKVNYNVVTLRKFNIRYDLLSLLGSYTWDFNKYSFRAGSGLLYKGDLGGESFQNGYHQFRAIKSVHIPYSSTRGLATIFSISGNWSKRNTLVTQDIIRLTLESKIYTNYVAARLSPYISYQAGFWQNDFQIETVISFRIYLNEADEYSNMLRTGISYGINTKINLFSNYYLDIGFITIPTKNIESDAVYPRYKNNYLPQAWLGFSYNTGWHSLIENIGF